jgi:hypothetical protein
MIAFPAGAGCRVFVSSVLRCSECSVVDEDIK